MVASLLMASGVYAEQKACHVTWVETFNDIALDMRNCKSGDVITWSGQYMDKNAAFRKTEYGRHVVAYYCHQEKQITTNADLSQGVCTYTGKKLDLRLISD